MYGLVLFSTLMPRGHAISRQEVLFGLRFCTVTICRTARTPAWLVRCRAEKAARCLQQSGVTRAVFPDPFPDLAVFQAHGVIPADPIPLYRAMAAPLILEMLQRRGLSPTAAVIALCGDRLTTEMRRAATELCVRSRYLLLGAPDPEGQFSRRLRREYGVSLVQTIEPSRLAQADIAALFAPSEGIAPSNALRLYGDGWRELPPLQLCREPEDVIPDGICCAQLLSALWTAGILRTGDLRFAPPSTANADDA